MRCAATFWLTRHDVIPKHKRDGDGALASPHVLVWECLRCGRIVGETTTLVPRSPPRQAPTPVVPRRRLHAITEKGRR